ncbi:MAG: glycosyltransferase, partial [Solirubrobacteraceae bacterium]
MPNGSIGFQRELRRVRAAALPRFTAVLPISDFIRDSQTLLERGTSAGVHTVLLGADHLEVPMFGAPSGEAADAASVAQVKRLAAQGYRLVISLGRFEPEGYKNSPAAYEVFARILERQPDARLLLLAKPEDLRPPEALRDAVLPLGFISDAALGAVMSRCALGLTMSRWEGFNLPLAEMQWCGRPVLAFNLGAHPEVVADPWLLCGSLDEMADKATTLIEHGMPPHVMAGDRFESFRRRFRWEHVIARYAETIEGLAVAAPVTSGVAQAPRVVLMDATSASIDPGNPGVIRVARRLGHALQQHPELRPIFVRWDVSLDTYRTLTPSERATLGSYDGPVDGISGLFGSSPRGASTVDEVLRVLGGEASPVLFVLEVILDRRFPERIAWARARGLPVAALLYDLIPVTHLPFCSAGIVSCFPEYLEALAAADAVWAISGETRRQFERYLARHYLPRPSQCEAIQLPAQLGAQPRVKTPPKAPRTGEPLTALCVSSIDPRKNHRNLIGAFRSLVSRRPPLPLRLVLVGNRFDGADDLAAWVEDVTREEPRITWTGLVGDAELAALFER